MGVKAQQKQTSRIANLAGQILSDPFGRTNGKPISTNDVIERQEGLSEFFAAARGKVKITPGHAIRFTLVIDRNRRRHPLQKENIVAEPGWNRFAVGANVVKSLDRMSTVCRCCGNKSSCQIGTGPQIPRPPGSGKGDVHL